MSTMSTMNIPGYDYDHKKRIGYKKSDYSSDFCLLYGYIRLIILPLLDKSQIIPECIINVCKIFYLRQIDIFLIKSNPESLSFINLTSCNEILFEIINNENKKETQISIVDDTRMIYVNDMALFNSESNTSDAAILIFSKQQSNAYIFNKHDLNTNKMMTAHQIRLNGFGAADPLYLLYSNKNGIISLFSHKLVYEPDLSDPKTFDYPSYFQTFPLLKTHNISACIMNENNLEFLFMIHNYRKSKYSYDDIQNRNTLLFNFQNEKWNKLNLIRNERIRKESGICYNSLKKSIFIGGGYLHLNDEYYDVESCYIDYFECIKNKWYKLPNTLSAHCRRPSLFFNQYSPSVLYIIGNEEYDVGQFEYCDLREFNRKWSIMDKKVTDWINITSDQKIMRIFAN